MRLWTVFVASGLVATACSSFGSEDSPEPDGGADGGIGSGDAGDLGLVVRALADAQIIQSESTTIPISVTLGTALVGSVTIDVVALPNGVTADALTFDGTSASLTLRAAPDTSQGNAHPIVKASVGGAQAIAPLNLLVRGRSGAADTTWGMNGQVSIVTEGVNSGTADLVLGPNDDVYSVSGALAPDDTGSGPNKCHAAHLDKNGALDGLYGAGGLDAFSCRFPHAAALGADGKLLVVGGARDVTTGFPESLSFFATLDAKGSSAAYHEYAAGDDWGAYALAAGLGGDAFVGFENVNTGPGPGIPQTYFLETSHLDSAGARVSSYGSGGTVQGPVSVPTAMFLQGDALVVVSIAADAVDYLQYDPLTGLPLPGFLSPKTIAYSGLRRPSAGAQGAAIVADGSLILPLNGTAAGVALLKLDAAGNAAAGFGSAGVAGPHVVAGTALATGIAAAGDGKLLVSFDTGGVARFTASGAPDITFGQSGFIATTTGASLHRKVVVQKSGRILVSGQGATASEVLVSAYWP